MSYYRHDANKTGTACVGVRVRVFVFFPHGWGNEDDITDATFKWLHLHLVKALPSLGVFSCAIRGRQMAPSVFHLAVFHRFLPPSLFLPVLCCFFFFAVLTVHARHKQLIKATIKRPRRPSHYSPLAAICIVGILAERWIGARKEKQKNRVGEDESEGLWCRTGPEFTIKTSLNKCTSISNSTDSCSRKAAFMRSSAATRAFVSSSCSR